MKATCTNLEVKLQLALTCRYACRLRRYFVVSQF